MTGFGNWKEDVWPEIVDAWHDGRSLGAVVGVVVFLLSSFFFIVFWPYGAWKAFRDWFTTRRPSGKYPILYLKLDFFGKIQRIGGTMTHSRGMVKALHRKHRTLVVSDEWLGHSDSYPLFYINRLRFISFFWNVFASFMVVPIALFHRPDFVYQRYSWNGFAGAIAAKLVGAKYILEWNGSDVWMNEHWNTKKHWSFPIRVCERWMLQRADKVVCVSQALKDQIIKDYYYDICWDKLEVIPNGYDPELFNDYNVPPYSRFRLDIPEDAFVVGWIGTFGPWHGIDILAQAIRRDQSGIRWLIIGHGPLVDEFLSKVADVYPKRYIYIPEVEHSMVGRYLRSCNVLLNLAVDNADGSPFFGSPTKLFEYLASGVPVITTDVGQPSTMLTHMSDCIKTRPDAIDLLHHIYYLRACPDLGRRIAKQAQMTVQTYTWDNIAMRVLR